MLHELLISRPAKLSKKKTTIENKTCKNIFRSSSSSPFAFSFTMWKICEWKTLLIENSCGCCWEDDMVSGCRTERNAPLKYFAFSAFQRPKEALIVRVMQRPEKEVNKLKLPLVFFLPPLCLPLYSRRQFRAKNICSRRQAGQARHTGRHCVCLPAASSRPKWA